MWTHRCRGSPNASAIATDLPDHPIVDRGRVVGLWQYDVEASELVRWWLLPTSGATPDRALREAIDETEAFVRDDLGDARSFSLDSPKSRAPRLAALRRPELGTGKTAGSAVRPRQPGGLPACRNRRLGRGHDSRASAKWQALGWPLPAVDQQRAPRSAQMSCAFQHRVRKRQPDGGLAGRGTSPCEMIRSRCSRAVGSGTGTADSSAWV